MTLRGVVALGYLFSLNPALAQDAEEVEVQEENLQEDITPAPSSDQAAEKIQIVGSRIKRIDMEGPQSIEMIDRATIERSGVTSISELLRSQSVAANFGNYRSQVNEGETPAAGGNGINLRGLGEKNTLVLLNGQRLPTDGISGSVDVSTIPMAAIERVEILKDGGSAIYGSDASGGVINLVTRKDFQGFNVTARYDSAKIDGGDITTLSAAYGLQTDRLSSTTILSYRKSEPVYERDLYYVEPVLSLYAFPANVYTDATETVAPATCETPRPDGNCGYDYTRTAQYYPKTTQISLLNTTEYQFDNGLQAFGRLLVSRHTDLHNMAPNAAQVTVPEATAQQLGIPGYQGGAATLFMRAVGLGNRVTEAEVDSYDLLAGVRGDFGATYTWELAASTGQQKIDISNPEGFARISSIIELINNDDYNPITADNPGGILPAKYEPFQVITTTQNKVDFSVTGDLWNLPGGIAAFSTGVSFLTETYKNTADEPSTQIDPDLGQSDVLGASASVGEGDRQASAVFAELMLPVIDSLELQLAGRFDNYSDFGSSFNPKFSFSYKPIQEVLIRGSAGTGFKAPPLRRLFQSRTETNPFMPDYQYCESQGISKDDCPDEQYIVYESGNKNLNEEVSESYNFGIVLQPLNFMSLSADIWDTKIKDAVPSSYDYYKVMEADSRDDIDLNNFGIQINRRTNGEIANIDAPLQNLAQQHIRGFDANLNMKYNTGQHRFELDSSYGNVIFFKTEEIPGLGLENILLDSGYPKWRLINNLTWATNSHAVAVRNSHIGNHRKRGDETQWIGSYSQWDAQYEYLHPWGGSITVGATNVFDNKPPLDDSRTSPTEYLINNLYHALGPVYYVAISQNF
ncbi:MAG: TonB-dependent receptor plug domain-containing protein [Oligoflexus sp.]